MTHFIFWPATVDKSKLSLALFWNRFAQVHRLSTLGTSLNLFAYLAKGFRAELCTETQDVKRWAGGICDWRMTASQAPKSSELPWVLHLQARRAQNIPTDVICFSSPGLLMKSGLMRHYRDNSRFFLKNAGNANSRSSQRSYLQLWPSLIQNFLFKKKIHIIWSQMFNTASWKDQGSFLKKLSFRA